MPKISFIIPVYKVEKYLPECLDSVLAQTMPDWETICVDDGSPDGCAKILTDYANRDNRIRVVSQSNQGVSMARNKGLSLAQGEYICFLDSDDELAPAFGEKMYDVAQRKKADIVSCDIQLGTQKKAWTQGKVTEKGYSSPFDAYMTKRLKLYMGPWAKLYKRDAINGLTFNQEISQCGEDILYLYQSLYQAKKLVHTSQKLYFYRKRPESVTTSKLSEYFAFGNIKMAELLLLWFKDKKLSWRVRKILNRKIAKRIFKFAVLEPKRKDKKNLSEWYGKTRPVLKNLKEQKIYQPKYLNVKNRLKSWMFLKGAK